MSGEIRQCFFQNRAVVDAGTQNDLRVKFYVVFQQSFQFTGNIGAFLVNSKQISAGFQISCVNRNVLRREALFDDALHLVFGNRA